MSKPEDWSNSPLYVKLVNVLPAYVKNPFGDAPKLDVMKLCAAIDLSYEGVYKWLRAGRMTAAGITAIVNLANQAPNVAALTALGRSPPCREDFTDFLFA